jgi:chorismate mutase / prephenate dehydratase
MTKVAIYGEKGSYTEQAAINYFGSKASLLELKYISEVFDAVEHGKADYGIVPIENSIEGAVTQTYDRLAEFRLHIIGETTLRINHCLIAYPGVRLGDVKKVYSLQQALGQCKEYLQRIKVETVPYYDTAGSVKMIKEEGSRDSAAIASARAASIYGMNVLARDIETNKHNYTRFFVVSRKESGKKGNKTSLAFTLKSHPGALYHVLNAFASNDIDLTYIQSRPILGQPWKYCFYVDCKGDRKDKKLLNAMRMLKKATKSLQILGSYRGSREER